MSDEVGKVNREKPLAGVKVLHRACVAKPRYPCFYARVVGGPVGHWVVNQLHVVHPAVDHPWHKLLQVEPQGEPVRHLVADVVDRRRLVQPSLDAITSVPGNQDDGVDPWPT